MSSFSVSNLLCSSSPLFSHGRNSHGTVPCFVFSSNRAMPWASKDMAEPAVKITRATTKDRDDLFDNIEHRPSSREPQASASHRPTTEISPFGFSPMLTSRGLLDRMDSVFEDAWWFPRSSRSGRRRPCDVTESETEVRMRFDMPGLSREEINIWVEGDNVLVIRAQHTSGLDVEDEMPPTRRYSSAYDTRLLLPDNVETERIQAEMRHGVLTIVLPKRKVDESQVFQVQVD